MKYCYGVGDLLNCCDCVRDIMSFSDVVCDLMNCCDGVGDPVNRSVCDPVIRFCFW